MLAEPMKTHAEIAELINLHTEEIGSLKARISAVENIVKNVATQTLQHSSILTEHAKLHTQHASGIVAAREDARFAKQSSSEVSNEVKSIAHGISAHVSTMGRSQTELVQETKIQSAALRKLVKWHASPYFKLAALIGAVLGGMIAGLLAGKGLHL